MGFINFSKRLGKILSKKIVRNLQKISYFEGIKSINTPASKTTVIYHTINTCVNSSLHFCLLKVKIIHVPLSFEVRCLLRISAAFFSFGHSHFRSLPAARCYFNYRNFHPAFTKRGSVQPTCPSSCTGRLSTGREMSGRAGEEAAGRPASGWACLSRLTSPLLGWYYVQVRRRPSRYIALPCAPGPLWSAPRGFSFYPREVELNKRSLSRRAGALRCWQLSVKCGVSSAPCLCPQPWLLSTSHPSTAVYHVCCVQRPRWGSDFHASCCEMTTELFFNSRKCINKRLIAPKVHENVLFLLFALNTINTAF